MQIVIRMPRLLSAALAVSVLANIFLAYRAFDMGITSTYAFDEIQRRSAQLSALQRLLPGLMSGTSRAALMGTAQTAGLEVIDKGGEGIYVGEILFVMSGDHVKSIEFN